MNATTTRNGKSYACVVLWAVVLLYCALLCVGALIPRDARYNAFVRMVPGGALMTHAVAYGILALLLCAALGANNTRNVRVAVLAVILSAAFGGILELMQMFTPSRKAGLADYAADFPGILLACSAWLAWRYLWGFRKRGLAA